MKKTKKRKKIVWHEPDYRVCRLCFKGSCCRDGVEVDLFEVARILKRYKDLDLPRPWFTYLGRGKTTPSGYKFSTVVRQRRCVFQDGEMRCLVYKVRPRYCKEFPFEDGQKAPFFKHLCHHPRDYHRKKKRRARKTRSQR